MDTTITTIPNVSLDEPLVTDTGVVTTSPVVTEATSVPLDDVLSSIERSNYQSASCLTFISVCLVIIVIWGVLKSVYNFFKDTLF